MTERDFLEVDTPTIEMIYGGAEARPFEVNIWALDNQKAYLRISPELLFEKISCRRVHEGLYNMQEFQE